MLGIANLKHIVPQLMNWATEDGENFEQLDELYGQVSGQFRRYIGHVTNNVGGVYEYYKTSEQNEAVYTHVPKSRQAQAIDFLNTQVFDTPEWIIDKEILSRVSNDETLEPISRLQSYALNTLFRSDRIERMVENEMINSNQAYTVDSLFADVEANIYKDIDSPDVTIPRKKFT